MKKQINLFYHLPKKLSLDAFLMWLFIFIDRNEELYAARNTFFDILILRPEDQGKHVSDLEARRKDQTWDNPTDIVLRFKLNGEPKTVLFENRITPVATLKGYESVFSNLYGCIYMKLETLEHQEYLLALKRGYLVRNIEFLLRALEPLVPYSSIIDHYCEYLEGNHLLSARKVSGSDFKSEDLFRLRSKYMKFVLR